MNVTARKKRVSFRGSEHAALGFVVRDDLSIARWRDGSDVVPHPPRGSAAPGVAEPRRGSRTGAGAPARARVWRTSSLAAEWSERSERNDTQRKPMSGQQ